jgi:integrase
VTSQCFHGTRSAGTQRTYLSFLKNHVRPRLDALMMWEVTAIICDDLIKDTRNAKGYDSAKTVRTILSAICSLAVRLGAIDVNPVRSTARLAKGRDDQKDVKAMTSEQIDEMLTGLGKCAINKEKDSKGRRVGKRVLVWRDLPELAEAMLATGVRIGEILATSGDDVIKDDDGKAAVRINTHIVRVKGQGLVRVSGRKGNKPGVILTIPSWSAATFARRKLAAGPNGPLFASLEGGWLDPSNTINRLREALNESGFAWVTSHVWRKTVATLLDEAGLNVSEIARPTRQHQGRHREALHQAQTPQHEGRRRPSSRSSVTTTRPDKRTVSGLSEPKTNSPEPTQGLLTWGFAPPAGLEPATLRLTAECSAN